jgi:hypothetical protein
MWMDTRKFLTWFCQKTKGFKPPKDRYLDIVSTPCDNPDYVSGPCERPVKFGPQLHRNHATWSEALGIEQAVKVHVTIELDQKFHYLCLALVAIWISF